MKEKIGQWIDKVGIQREKLVPFILSMAIIICYMVGAYSLGNTILTIELILICIMMGIILSFTMIKAGYIIFKSLVGIGAALTLFVFLTQTYCALPTTTPEGITALRGIFGISLFCIVYEFFKTLYEAFQQNINNFKEKDGKWSGEGITILVLFILFLLQFLYWIYQVMFPIISSLCIYK